MTDDVIRFRDKELKEKVEAEAEEKGIGASQVYRERLLASYGIGIDKDEMKAANEKMLVIDEQMKAAKLDHILESTKLVKVKRIKLETALGVAAKEKLYSENEVTYNPPDEPNFLRCPVKDCKEIYSPGFYDTLKDHLIEVHHIAAVKAVNMAYAVN